MHEVQQRKTSCHRSFISFFVRIKSQLLDDRSRRDDRKGMSEAGVNRCAM